MRKILISFLFLLACGLIGFWTALQSPRVWEYVLMKTFNAGRMLQIREVSIDAVHWDFPHKVVLENVRTKLKINDIPYFVSMSSVQLQSKHSLLRFSPRAKLTITHTAVVSDFLNISDAQWKGLVNFKHLKLQNAHGRFSAQELDIGHYALNALDSDLRFSPGHLKLRLKQGWFAQGSINADIMMDYRNQMAYSINISAKGINFSKLAEANPRIFGAADGLVNARVAVRSKAGHLILLTAAFDAPRGGHVKSYVLHGLAQYIPQGRQLNSLIKNKMECSFDRGSAVLTSRGGGRFSTQIKMLSSALNLDMNVTLDVIVDHGILSLLDDLNDDR